MNHIQIYDNALSKDACNNIIAYFNDHPNLEQGRTGKGIRKDIKNGKNLTVLFKDCSKFMYDLLGSDIIPSLNIGIEKYKKNNRVPENDRIKLEALFEKNLNDTKEELKKINS